MLCNLKILSSGKDTGGKLLLSFSGKDLYQVQLTTVTAVWLQDIDHGSQLNRCTSLHPGYWTSISLHRNPQKAADFRDIQLLPKMTEQD